MLDSLLQPASVNHKDVSRYLKKTKQDQKKYDDRHARSEVEELQPGTKVRMQPWTNSNSTVVRHHHTPRSYVVQAEDGRKYRRNRQDLRVCPAPGHGSLNAEPSLESSAHQNLPRDEPNHAAAPPVSPVIPLQERHHDPEPPKADSSEPYVTRSGRRVVKPERLDL